MNYKLKDIYIGKIIQDKVDEKGIRYSDFAKQINCARTTLYHIFSSKSIDIERLVLISEVLEFDFIANIYTKEYSLCMHDGHAYIHIPFKNGDFDLTQIPETLIRALKKSIEKMER